MLRFQIKRDGSWEWSFASHTQKPRILLPVLFTLCRLLTCWGVSVEGSAQGFLPQFAKHLFLGKRSNDLPVFILCIGPQGLSADGAPRSDGEG